METQQAIRRRQVGLMPLLAPVVKDAADREVKIEIRNDMRRVVWESPFVIQHAAGCIIDGDDTAARANDHQATVGLSRELLKNFGGDVGSDERRRGQIWQGH